MSSANPYFERMLAEAQKTPYFNLSGYMNRLWLTPNPKEHEGQTLSARLHHLLRADTDDVMHDHPCDNLSVIQSGCYVEMTPMDQAQDPALDSSRFTYHVRNPGDVVFRRATDRHRIVKVSTDTETWSLFICGPWLRDWGFHTPERWVYWREYLNEWGDDPAPGGFTENVRPDKEST